MQLAQSTSIIRCGAGLLVLLQGLTPSGVFQFPSPRWPVTVSGSVSKDTSLAL